MKTWEMEANMKEKDNNIIPIREIALTDLWRVFVDKLWVLLLVMALVVDAVVCYQKLMVEPRYESTAVLYILKQQDESNSSSATASDFSLALNVVNDCTFLLKSSEVIDQVLEHIDSDYTYEELSDNISTSNPDSTRILEVTVQTDDPTEAKQIVDTLCKIGVDEITEAMGFQQVNLYEYGTYSDTPCNEISPKRILLFGIIAAAAVYLIFVALSLLDDSLQTDEDMEERLGLTVLGRIPTADGHGQKR